MGKELWTNKKRQAKPNDIYDIDDNGTLKCRTFDDCTSFF